MRSGLYRAMAIAIGSLGLAVGINFFLLPFKILDGGIIGISLILHYLFEVKVGATLVFCSIPIFILAWLKDRHAFFGSALGLLIASFIIDLIAPFRFHFMYAFRIDPVTSAILGGCISGTAIGIMLRNGVSTGGTDLLAFIIARYRGWNAGIIILLLDCVVVTTGGLLISAETFFLSVLSIVVGGMATSLITLHDIPILRKK